MWAASFVRGLRNRHPLVLVTALTLACLMAVTFEVAVRSGLFTVVAEGRLLRISHDDYAHVTYTVAELRDDPPQGRTVYLFGGSAAMECFVSESSLAADVSRASGSEAGVVSLAAHGQSFAQAIAVVDNLPAAVGDGRVLLAIGLAPMRFTVAPEKDAGLMLGRTMPLPSARLREALAGQGIEEPALTTVLPGAFDYLSTYMAGRPDEGLAWLEDVDYEEHYWNDQPVRSRAAKEGEATARTTLDRELYRRYASYNLAMLDELLRLARDRGFAVALFEQPLNLEVADSTWGGILPDYRRRVRAIARRWGVTYLDVHRRVALENEDFGDIYHLVVSGRLKWQPVLAEQLAGVLVADGGAGAAAAP